jgi:hypothetical protein
MISMAIETKTGEMHKKTLIIQVKRKASLSQAFGLALT